MSYVTSVLKSTTKLNTCFSDPCAAQSWLSPAIVAQDPQTDMRMPTHTSAEAGTDAAFLGTFKLQRSFVPDHVKARHLLVCFYA